MQEMFEYYELQLKLITPMLGTCAEASIYDEHLLKKHKKNIKKANSLEAKITKAIEKYVGTEISENKEIQELKGIIRGYMEIVGESVELPDNTEELLAIAKEFEERVNDLVAKGESLKSTIFMRDVDGWPMISSHMILGNIKENLKIITNNGDKSILKTKVSVSEVLALDVKPVEQFIRPSQDIIRDALENPEIDERPIRFNDNFGKVVTAISRAEQLPKGTIFTCTLRVRKGSPMNEVALNRLFNLGKNQGLGQWRGSGNKGAYKYKLKKLKDFIEPADPDGFI